MEQVKQRNNYMRVILDAMLLNLNTCLCEASSKFTLSFTPLALVLYKGLLSSRPLAFNCISNLCPQVFTKDALKLRARLSYVLLR